VRRADGGRAEASYGKWLSAEFRRPTWYGFMTYGDGGTIWDLKHFSVKASGE